jgi:hypothetical protein
VRLQPSRIAKAVAAAVSFTATAIGLIFGLWPALKPSEPPAAKGATLSQVTLDRVRYGQYLDRIAVSRYGYRQAQLERGGVLVGVTFKVTGYQSKRLPLQWRLIDARTGDQIEQSRDLFYVPAANEDQNSWSVWVAVPPGGARRFFIEVELLDDRGAVPLGRVRTERFHGT